ncbi:hypothetical protein BHM03_00045786 [Ensete ventricosum]|nr:hypothetical protein BHM03_00045786 [Ensete ventricosum]
MTSPVTGWRMPGKVVRVESVNLTTVKVLAIIGDRGSSGGARTSHETSYGIDAGLPDKGVLCRVVVGGRAAQIPSPGTKRETSNHARVPLLAFCKRLPKTPPPSLRLSRRCPLRSRGRAPRCFVWAEKPVGVQSWSRFLFHLSLRVVRESCL